ncbi:hypothetical protein EDD86DRAFT_211541 [Gorgonomyces haynaldii]|nr:hypothetical protein EDD86DRAFT_211541 [Gorgonomyces haynaldii]
MLLIVPVLAQRRYPPGCGGRQTFPNETLCKELNWDLGPNAVDKCAPYGPYPVSNEQVYIQDPLNFCMILPDPNNPYIKSNYYDKGVKPTIVQGEGYVQAFCIGNYMTPGAMKLNPLGLLSAHVTKGKAKNGKEYIQIVGTLDADPLNISFKSSVPGAFDDGGQYDSVSYRNCGKEPYSGVDATKHPKYKDYVEQAGNGEFCMRVCEAGQQLEDPCNVKNDTAGCRATFGVVFKPGFSYTDLITGETKTFDSPIPTTTSVVPTTAAPTQTLPAKPASTPNAVFEQGPSFALFAFAAAMLF